MRSNLIKYLVAGVLSLVAFTGAFADEGQQKDGQTAGPNRVFGAVDWNHSNLKDGSEKMTGKPWGGLVGYEFKEVNNIYFYARGMWNGSKMDNASNRYYNHSWRAYATVGYTFDLGEGSDFTVSPYVGLGYRSNRMNWSTAATVATDAKNKFHAWEVPVGLFFNWDVAPEFNVGLDVQAQWMFNSRDTMTVVTPAAAHTVEKGKNHVNWRFELPLTYQVNSEWDLGLVPHYSQFNFTPSGTTDKVKTTDYGVRLEAGYSF